MQASTFGVLSTTTNGILLSSFEQRKSRTTTRSQEPAPFDPAPVDNVKMEFEMAASYQHQRATSLKKRKQVALKAIETNFNDPAIEKAILHQIIMSQHSINDKENKLVVLLLLRGRKFKPLLRPKYYFVRLTSQDCSNCLVQPRASLWILEA
jgi:hypothetical protein